MKYKVNTDRFLAIKENAIWWNANVRPVIMSMIDQELDGILQGEDNEHNNAAVVIKTLMLMASLPECVVADDGSYVVSPMEERAGTPFKYVAPRTWSGIHRKD
jgi:hypothetical protein